MKTRLTLVIGAMLLVASSNGSAAAAAASEAGDSYRLASAQVVTSTSRPPVLKLTASGPIAFQALPTDANGNPTGPGRIVARLFGVAPGDLASFGDLSPFALTITSAEGANPTDTDTIVTITTGAGATSGQMLVLRAGMKSNELEAAIVAVQ